MTTSPRSPVITSALTTSSPSRSLVAFKAFEYLFTFKLDNFILLINPNLVATSTYLSSSKLDTGKEKITFSLGSILINVLTWYPKSLCLVSGIL